MNPTTHTPLEFFCLHQSYPNILCLYTTVMMEHQTYHNIFLLYIILSLFKVFIILLHPVIFSLCHIFEIDWSFSSPSSYRLLHHHHYYSQHLPLLTSTSISSFSSSSPISPQSAHFIVIVIIPSIMMPTAEEARVVVVVNLTDTAEISHFNRQI